MGKRRNSGVGFVCLLVLITGSFSLEAIAMEAMQCRIEAENIIVDQAGRKVVAAEPFKRIISLYGAHTENLFQLGLTQEIIGVSHHETYPPQALHKPGFSYHDDPEKFLAVQPDLVIIRPMIDHGYPQFVSMLENSGIKIVSLQPDSIDDMYTYWFILGILTGTAPRAKQMISQFKAAVAEFRRLTLNHSAKKRVYFEAIHGKMKTFTPESMAIFAVETAGGINIAKDAKQVRSTNIADYGKERLLSHAAEIDVYLAQTGAMNQPTLALIQNEPGFKAIKAVSENQIHIIDEEIVSRPTLRLLFGIYEIGKTLYPDIYDGRAHAIPERATSFQ
jgi:iron complex transport system substrate-binding protein